MVDQPEQELPAAALDAFRTQLLTLQKSLTAELEAHSDSARPVDLETPIGRLSRMDALQQQNIAKANRQNTETRLRLTAAAIRALDENTYGTCRSCEEPIPRKRLKARPETPFCMRCQRRN